MNDNTRSLLIYLEAQLVIHQGFVHQRELTHPDRMQIELWQKQGLIEIEKIKQPERRKRAKKGSVSSTAIPDIFTHRIRFSPEMWNMAWAARKEKAEITRPTLKIHKKEKENHQSPITNHQSKIDFEDFKKFLTDNGESMTIPQEQFAKGIIQTLNQDGMNYFVAGKQTGKSWVLRAVDQYLTGLTKGWSEKDEE